MSPQLGTIRSNARELLGTMPPPDRVSHLWRYTDPEALLPGDFPSPLSAGAGARISLDRTVLAQEDREAGVIFTSLEDAVAHLWDLVEPHLEKILATDHSRFSALDAAIWDHGTFLWVPPGVKVSRPLRNLVRVEDHGYLALRNLLVVGDGGEVTYIEDGTGAPSHVLTVTEARIGAGAKVVMTGLQRWDPGTNHIETRASRLARDAHLDDIQVTMGGNLTKLDGRVWLEGQGASLSTYGVFFGDAHQHLDHHFEVEHIGSDTSSDLDCRVVVGDHARSVFTGMLRILETGVRANANQSIKNLMLTDSARADAIPELEILTDDVKASHGATAGPVDAEHLYYLQSRGITPEVARRMLTQGFMEPVIDRIPAQGIKIEVRELLAERLRQA